MADTDTTNSDLAALIKSSIAEMNNGVNTRLDSLSYEINTRIDTLTNSIETRIQNMDTKFDTVTEDLASKLHKAHLTINQQSKEIQEHDRKFHLTDGVFFGIPFVANENLNEIFLSLCRKINFEMDQYNVVSIHRQSTSKKEHSSPIFVKFLSPAVRSHFFTCYLANLNINLRDIGFDVDKRVYFYESISKFAQIIFRKAIVLKKNNQLSRVHTFNGYVFVRLPNSLESIRVIDTNHLDSLVESSLSTKRRLSDGSKQPSCINGSMDPALKMPKTCPASTALVSTKQPTISKPHPAIPSLTYAPTSPQSPLIPHSQLFPRKAVSQVETSTRLSATKTSTITRSKAGSKSQSSVQLPPRASTSFNTS